MGFSLETVFGKNIKIIKPAKIWLNIKGNLKDKNKIFMLK
jgi:hypothetical protein